MSKDKGGDTFNIQSNNQHGGITAGQVNIGHPGWRDISTTPKEFFDQLIEAIESYKEAGLMFICTHNDPESSAFTIQLMGYLKNLGYKVKEPPYYLHTEPAIHNVSLGGVDEEGRCVIRVGPPGPLQ